MKITETEVFALGDRSRVPWGIDALAFVAVHTDEGMTGFSEVFPVPPGVAKAALEGPDSFFGRHLIGEDVVTPERIANKLYYALPSYSLRGWAVICIGAAEVALWDLLGKMWNRPVYQLIGGAERDPRQIAPSAPKDVVIPYCTIVADDYEGSRVVRSHLDRIETLRAEGFRAFKVEPMFSTSDVVVETAKEARRLLGNGPMLAVDVGKLWSDVGEAIQVASRLADYDVFFLETPFRADAIEAYAKLTARSPIRIAADEHSVTRWEFLNLMDHGGIHVVQPYVVTCGGITEAKRIVELALPRGVLVCPGNWSTHVQGAAAVHLAAYSPITPYIEYVPAQVYQSPLRKALQDIGLPVTDGAIAYPSSAGIGVDVPRDLISHFRVA